MTELVKKVDDMVEVVRLLAKGQSHRQIAERLGITPATVVNRIADWESYVAADLDIQRRAKQTLAQTDTHYNEIISEFWRTFELAESSDDVKTMNAILKNIATTEADRVKLYAAAGLTSDNELAAQMLETENKQKIIMDMLREVSGKCPRCSGEIRRRMQEITPHVTQIVEVHES